MRLNRYLSFTFCYLLFAILTGFDSSADMRWVILLACIFVPKLFAADNLLIMDVFARVTPAGQTAPNPDPFIESILRDENSSAPEDVSQLGRKWFQINSTGQDFKADLNGIGSQRIAVSFTVSVSSDGDCAVTNFQALASATNKQAFAPGSSQVSSAGGFTVSPGKRVTQSLTAVSDAGQVTYYLIFSAAKGVAG